MGERGTSGEGEGNRLGCHASVTILWLEESAQGKQGGSQGNVCNFVFGFFFFFAKCTLKILVFLFKFERPQRQTYACDIWH